MANIALQLYTVREEMAKDVVGTLKKVSELGYKGVEFAGFFDTPAEEMKRYLERFNLSVVGSHTSLEDILHATEQVIEYNRIIENQYIICPWAKLTNKEELEELTKCLGKVIPLFWEKGMKILYHNHEHELKDIEGTYILDQLIGGFSEEDLNLELDTFWVHYAGVDIGTYMEEHKERIVLIHLKDGQEGRPSAIGEGEVPIEKIIKVAQKLEIPWLIVENDNPSPNGIEDITRSIKSLKKILK